MSDVDGLIARLERATGPDRLLDGDIAETLKLPPSDYKRWDINSTEPARWQLGIFAWDAPEYTKSIDTALTLVPEGWRWCVADYNLGPKPWAELAEVGQIMDYGIGIKCRAQAGGATPAIALCIACLRAHTANTKQEG